jgi:hypothetical protein
MSERAFSDEALESLWQIYHDPLFNRTGNNLDERNMACTIRALILDVRSARAEIEAMTDDVA